MTWRALLATGVTALLSACVAVPVPVSHTAGPEPGSRGTIADTVPPTLVSGQTTRMQVLMSLGEPDGRGEGDTWFVYESIDNRGGVQWAFAAIGMNGNGGAGPLGNWDLARRLTIRFSAAGIVSDVSLQRRECSLWGGTSDYGISQSKGDCLDPRGSDLAKQDMKAKAAASAGAIVARYDQYWFVDSQHTNCEYPGVTAVPHYGQSFTVGEHAIIWEEAWTETWRTLPLADIAEVRPVEKHWLNHWMIPIEKRDGSCMFVSVNRSGSAAGSTPKELQEGAREAVLSRLGTLNSAAKLP